jgi:ecoA family type I restriction-modification enzyme, S subunit
MVTYPSDWQEDNVSNVVDISTGCRDTQDNKTTGRYPFFVRSPIVERIDMADYDCEAVLTAGDGVGTGKVFHYYSGKFAAHQRVYVMNNFRDVDGKYFYYFFSKNFIKEVEKYTAKSSVDSVRRAMIADMEFMHPQLLEQQDIVQVLTNFDSYIDDLAELIEKNRGIRDGALEDLMCQRIRLNGHSADWREVPLSEICKVYDGTHQTPKYTLQGIRFVSVENIMDLYNSNKYISQAAYVSDFKAYPEKGDILMTRIGDIGTPCVVDRDEPLAYYVSLALFKNIAINSYFLNYYIMSSGFQRELNDRTLHHATPKKINKGEIGKCKVKYPKDADEQTAIADILVAMDDEIEALETERDKMIQIREGAMDDLLTGRVRLRV